MKYRKKPVVIEAFQYSPEIWRSEAPTWPDWLQDAIDNGTVFTQQFQDVAVTFINTLEGVQRCAPGDFIIRGVKGELYSCKPDVFTLTYEAVED